MVAVLASVAAMGVGHAFLPTDPVLNAGYARFLFEPRLGATEVTGCGGTAPGDSSCSRGVSLESCLEGTCAPQISGTLGFTGTVSASLRGRDCSWKWDAGTGECLPDRQIAITRTCNFVGGQAATVVGVSAGSGCWRSPGDPNLCDSLGCTLWPPYSLQGSVAAWSVGPWKVSIVR
jgi:hypothetical protein